MRDNAKHSARNGLLAHADLLGAIISVINQVRGFGGPGRPQDDYAVAF